MNGVIRDVLASLESAGSKKGREGYARYGIVAPKAFGVPMGAIQKIGRTLGRDHDLADALWRTGWYEARLLACYVDDPAAVTAAQMDRWCKDFDNWGICDTACFVLFDRTPHAFAKVSAWAKRRPEFQRRAGFALLASLARHDELAPDAAFLRRLPLVETAAADERNFVKKGVSWALRGIGHRNAALHTAAVDLARRLAASHEPSARFVGKDALRDLLRPLVTKRLASAK
jgi:3-methyladenine DNA glycosylase AlkD